MVAFIVVAVFLPEQVAQAVEYDWRVLWQKPAIGTFTPPYLKDIRTVDIPQTVRNILKDIAGKPITAIQVSPTQTIKLEKPLNISAARIDELYNWLKGKPCGTKALYDYLGFKGVQLQEQDIAVMALTVDILNDVVKPEGNPSVIKNSLYALSKASEFFGQKLYPVKMQELEGTVPFIAHLNGDHYVLVTKIAAEKVYLSSNHKEAVLSKQEFLSEFSGYALVEKAEKSALIADNEAMKVMGAADDDFFDSSSYSYNWSFDDTPSYTPPTTSSVQMPSFNLSDAASYNPASYTQNYNFTPQYTAPAASTYTYQTTNYSQNYYTAPTNYSYTSVQMPSFNLSDAASYTPTNYTQYNPSYNFTPQYTAPTASTYTSQASNYSQNYYTPATNYSYTPVQMPSFNLNPWSSATVAAPKVYTQTQLSNSFLDNVAYRARKAIAIVTLGVVPLSNEQAVRYQNNNGNVPYVFRPWFSSDQGLSTLKQGANFGSTLSGYLTNDVLHPNADFAKIAQLNKGFEGKDWAGRQDYINLHKDEYLKAGAISIFNGLNEATIDTAVKANDPAVFYYKNYGVNDSLAGFRTGYNSQAFKGLTDWNNSQANITAWKDFKKNNDIYYVNPANQSFKVAEFKDYSFIFNQANSGLPVVSNFTGKVSGISMKLDGQQGFTYSPFNTFHTASGTIKTTFNGAEQIVNISNAAMRYGFDQKGVLNGQNAIVILGRGKAFEILSGTSGNGDPLRFNSSANYKLNRTADINVAELDSNFKNGNLQWVLPAVDLTKATSSRNYEYKDVIASNNFGVGARGTFGDTVTLQNPMQIYGGRFFNGGFKVGQTGVEWASGTHQWVFDNFFKNPVNMTLANGTLYTAKGKLEADVIQTFNGKDWALNTGLINNWKGAQDNYIESSSKLNNTVLNKTLSGFDKFNLATTYKDTLGKDGSIIKTEQQQVIQALFAKGGFIGINDIAAGSGTSSRFPLNPTQVTASPSGSNYVQALDVLPNGKLAIDLDTEHATINPQVNLTNAKVVFSGTNTEKNTPDSYIAIGNGRYMGNGAGMLPTEDGRGTFTAGTMQLSSQELKLSDGTVLKRVEEYKTIVDNNGQEQVLSGTKFNDLKGTTYEAQQDGQFKIINGIIEGPKQITLSDGRPLTAEAPYKITIKDGKELLEVGAKFKAKDGTIFEAQADGSFKQMVNVVKKEAPLPTERQITTQQIKQQIEQASAQLQKEYKQVMEKPWSQLSAKEADLANLKANSAIRQLGFLKEAKQLLNQGDLRGAVGKLDSANDYALAKWLVEKGLALSTHNEALSIKNYMQQAGVREGDIVALGKLLNDNKHARLSAYAIPGMLEKTQAYLTEYKNQSWAGRIGVLDGVLDNPNTNLAWATAKGELIAGKEVVVKPVVRGTRDAVGGLITLIAYGGTLGNKDALDFMAKYAIEYGHESGWGTNMKPMGNKAFDLGVAL
ncbi:MAG: cysteine peptidase family C39 domain-containing protein, partial [Candidatus Omnitrophota bacterium]